MPMSDPIEHLRAAGYGPAKLARLLDNISSQAISQWRKVPEDRVLEVERVTGISRHELRPDLSRIFVDSTPSPERTEA